MVRRAQPLLGDTLHQAILNRVLCSDGVWRALDGKAIDEIIQTITASQPALPSRIAASVPQLKGDLDRILKQLEVTKPVEK